MKKMRKAKVITALALTVVMLAALTGIAVADDAQLHIYYTGTTNEVASVDLVPGASFNQFDLVVTSMANGPDTEHNLTTLITPGVGGGAAGDIIVNYMESGGSQGAAPYTWTQTGASLTGSDTLTLFIKSAAGATVGAHYTVTIMDTVPGGVGVTFDIGVASTQATNIPEFATIAIPVAAILGLVLFFNHRKHKKE